MQKTASKNMIPSESYEFKKNWVAIMQTFMQTLMHNF